MGIIGKIVELKDLETLGHEVQSKLKLQYKEAHQDSQKPISEAEYRLLKKVLPETLRDLPPTSDFLV